MSQLTDFEQLRRKRSNRKNLRRLGLLAALGLLLVGSFLALRFFEQVDIGEEVARVTDQFSAGEGYPVSVYGGQVRSMGREGSSVSLLTENTFYSLGPSGNVQMNISHNYFNPVMVATSRRVLLYDREGMNLRVENREKNLWNKTCTYPITAADMNEDGLVAVATGSGRYKGEVTVYNKDFEPIYSWFSAENRILGLTLSDKGNLMAVGTVDASGGVLQSVISLFRFSADNEVARVTLADEILLSLDYKGTENTLYAITDKAVYAIGPTGAIEKTYSYAGEKLWAYHNASDKSIILVLGDYTEQRQVKLYRLDTQLTPTGPTILAQRMLDIKCDGKNTYVLVENQLYQFGEGLELTATYAVPDAKAIQPVRGEVYYATDEKVDKAISEQLVNPAQPEAQAARGRE